MPRNARRKSSSTSSSTAGDPGQSPRSKPSSGDSNFGSNAAAAQGIAPSSETGPDTPTLDAAGLEGSPKAQATGTLDPGVGAASSPDGDDGGHKDWFADYVVPRVRLALQSKARISDDATKLLKVLGRLRNDIPALGALLPAPADAPAQTAQQGGKEAADHEQKLNALADSLFAQLKGLLVAKLGLDAGLSAQDEIDYRVQAFDAKRPQLQAALSLFDDDGDGKLTRHDLRAWWEADRNLTQLADQVPAEQAAIHAASSFIAADQGALQDAIETANGWSDSSAYCNLEENYWPSYPDVALRKLPNDVKTQDNSDAVVDLFRHYLPQLRAQLSAKGTQAASTSDARKQLEQALSQRCAPVVSTYGGSFEADPDKMRVLKASMGQASLTFHVGLGPHTDPKLWLDRGKALVQQEGDRTSSAGLQAQDAASISRPYLVRDIYLAGRSLAEGLAQARHYAYDLFLEVRAASADDIEAIARVLPGHLLGLKVQGQALSPTEFKLLKDYFSWGDTPAVCLDQATGRGVYESQSVEGQQAREEQQFRVSGNLENRNKARGQVGRSTLGQASPAEIQQMLGVIRGNVKNDLASETGRIRDVLAQHASKTKGAGSVTLPSKDKRLNGKTLRMAAQEMFFEMKALAVRQQEMAEKKGLHIETVQRELSTLSHSEIREDNIEGLRKQLDAVKKETAELDGEFPGMKVRQAVVQQRTQAIYAGFAQQGTAETAVSNAFFKLNKAEIVAVQQLYAKTYGAFLRTIAQKELSGTDLDEILAYLDLDLATATALRLKNSLGIINDNEKRIFDTLRDVDPKVRKELEAATSKDAPMAKFNLDQAREGVDKGAERSQFDALLKGDTVIADAQALRIALGTTDLHLLGHTFKRSKLKVTNWTEGEKAVFRVLERGDKAHRQKVLKKYGEITGVPLDADLYDLLSDLEYERAADDLEGDAAGAAAARLQAAASGPGTTEAEIRAVFKGTKKAQRRAIEEAFDLSYGNQWKGGENSLQSMFLSESNSAAQYDAWEQLRIKGKVKPALDVYLSMKGAGTDPKMLQDAVKGMAQSKAMALFTGFRELCVQYGDISKNWKGSERELMREWIASDFGGREERDAWFAVLGEPQSPKEKLHRAKDLVDYEQDGSFGAGLVADIESLGDRSLDRSKNLTRQYMRLRRMTTAGGELKKGVSKEDFDSQYGMVTAAAKTLASARTAVADAIKTGGEIAVAAIATLLTEGAAAPWLVAVISGAATGATGIALKYAIEGKAYSDEKIATDAIIAAFGAVLAGATAAEGAIAQRLEDMAKVFGEGGAKEIAKSALMGGLQEGAKGAFEQALNEKNWKQGIEHVLLAMGREGGLKALQGAVGSLGGETFKQGTRPDASGYVMRSLIEAGSAVSGQAAKSVVTPSMWDKGPEEFLKAAAVEAFKAMVSAMAKEKVDDRVAQREFEQHLPEIAARLKAGVHPRNIKELRFFSEHDQELIYAKYTRGLIEAFPEESHGDPNAPAPPPLADLPKRSRRSAAEAEARKTLQDWKRTKQQREDAEQRPWGDPAPPAPPAAAPLPNRAPTSRRAPAPSTEGGEASPPARTNGEPAWKQTLSRALKETEPAKQVAGLEQAIAQGAPHDARAYRIVERVDNDRARALALRTALRMGGAPTGG